MYTFDKYYIVNVLTSIIKSDNQRLLTKNTQIDTFIYQFAIFPKKLQSIKKRGQALTDYGLQRFLSIICQ